MRQVTLVAGPPCAGKTSYVTARAGHDDLVLDQDTIGPAAMTQALATMPGYTGTSWVIRCAAGPTRRAQLAERIRATDTVLLVPDRTLLVARARQRPDPRRHLAAVDAWLRAELADAPPAQRTPASPRPAAPRSRHRVGRPHRRAVTQMFAIYGDLCHLCGHPGARQADHLVPIRDWPDQPIDPHLMRPAHGGGNEERGLDNPCPICGRRCNQERGARPTLSSAGFTTDDF